jgi:hypothetical protein
MDKRSPFVPRTKDFSEEPAGKLSNGAGFFQKTLGVGRQGYHQAEQKVTKLIG